MWGWGGRLKEEHLLFSNDYYLFGLLKGPSKKITVTFCFILLEKMINLSHEIFSIFISKERCCQGPFYLTVLFLWAKKFLSEILFWEVSKASGINFPTQSVPNIPHYKNHRTGWADKTFKSLFWDKSHWKDIFQFPKRFRERTSPRPPLIEGCHTSLCNCVLHSFEKLPTLRLPGGINTVASNPYLSF